MPEKTIIKISNTMTYTYYEIDKKNKEENPWSEVMFYSEKY